MNFRSKIIILICIVALAAVVASLYFLNKKDASDVGVVNNPTSTLDSGKIYGLHNIDNGVHTLVGNVVLPNPCLEITVEAVVAESMPEQVTILFSSSSTAGFCAQVVSQKYFEVKFQASKGAKIRAIFDNAPVELFLQNANSEEIINFIIANKWKTKI